MDNYNLLNLSIIRKLVLSKIFPYFFQAIALIGFIGLTVLSWQVFTPDGVNDKLFAKTHIVTLIIWGLWWPSMVLVAVTFGRAWCSVCPLELVSNITERLSRKFGIKQKVLPKWIRAGSIILVLYAIIQLLVAGVHIHRIPAYTSFFLIGLISLAAITGIIFKDRAFCRGYCPVGLLLNAYGRGAIFAVRPSSKEACSNCFDKECLSSAYRNNLDKRSCPSLLNPSKLSDNSDCLVCGQCIKSCNSENMELVLRKPFSKDDVREEKPNLALTFFILMVTGFVTYELTTEWAYAKSIFLFVPTKISEFLSLENYFGWIKGVWTIGIFPISLWLIFGIINYIRNKNSSLIEFWQTMALPLVVLVASGHVIKGLAKLNTWLSFLPHSINDVSGNNTPQLISQGIVSPEIFLGNITISLIGVTILSFGLFYSLREVKLRSIKNRFNYFPTIALFVIYLSIVIGIGFK